MLTQILHLDNTGSSFHQVPLIEQLIQSLPKCLRRQPRLSLGRIRSSGLCEVHKRLNADLMTDSLSLVQSEVTTRFRQLDVYPELVPPVERDILARLRALQGMWTKPSMNNPVAPNALPYQINGCPACILARIAADSEIIRDLRVVLQSRTRTRKNHRAPTLMVFVDECIRQFGDDEADKLFGTASNLAFQMKITRKACVKARYRDNKHSHRHMRKSCVDRRHHNRNSDGAVDIPDYRRSHVPSIGVIQEGNIASHHSKSSLARVSLYEPSPGANNSTASVHSWGDVKRQLSMVKTCRQIANETSYSRATSVPEARVAPLRISKVESRFEEQSQTRTKVPQRYDYHEHERSVSHYSSSDYWTDASLDSDDDDAAPEIQPHPRSQSFASRKQPEAAMTTWSLVCGQGNMI
ncbi:uncharacterized protein N7498_005926 [Penicillium cinerascens]|uniref:Uncharacterized protein n=1 Tax=Penicillium cinerascens TaxID=70096 RepID=A0A9W9MPD4_9EURO|nr:uncharacterized protein N7498_005926 [Penicillium cinerascens]KAJ5205047.1 hypothetical protein N7498_005926 [Penicillium cinerascens]